MCFLFVNLLKTSAILLFSCYRKLDSIRKLCSPRLHDTRVTAHDGCDDDKNVLSSLEAESKETPPPCEGTVCVVFSTSSSLGPR